MAQWKKIAIGTGIAAAVAGIYLFARKAVGLNQSQKELETVVRPSVHSINLQGITIRLDITIKNPNKTGFTMSFPFVKLLYNGNTIGSSMAINKKVTVPAYGEAIVDAIMVKMTGISAISTSFGLVKSLLVDKKPATLTAVVTSDVDMGVVQYPYKREEPFTLKPKTA